jgi:hypothetical protein
VVASLALIARRRRPVAVAVVTAATFVVYYARGYPAPVVAFVPVVIAIYTGQPPVSLARSDRDDRGLSRKAGRKLDPHR